MLLPVGKRDGCAAASDVRYIPPNHSPARPSPLPNSPGISASIDYFGPLLTMTRGNPDILLFRDRLSHNTGMFIVSAVESNSRRHCQYPHPPFCPKMCPPFITLAYINSQQAPITLVKILVLNVLTRACNCL